jgi:two-component system, chemotaxis family, chemotaxis protein CheY
VESVAHLSTPDQELYPPLRVLLVDDNAAFLQAMADLVTTEPCMDVVGCATSGLEALDLVPQLRPDLVLLDFAMPEMNGVETTRCIKTLPNPPQVVILTLYDNKEYRSAAQAAQVDGFIAKSHISNQLTTVVYTLFADRYAPTREPAEEEAVMRNILVVDDSPTMRRMVIASLQGMQNVRFEQAGSGLEAIESLALKPAHLIVLDLNMPDIHGLEVIEFVRRHKAFRTIPIIVLTTRGEESIRTTTLEAGASCYLTKPFQPQVLTQHAHELLETQS